MSQLYVGNLSSEVTERHVHDVFSQYGSVKEVILKSGFAFVEMEDSAGARLSKNELNGEQSFYIYVRILHAASPIHLYC